MVKLFLLSILFSQTLFGLDYTQKAEVKKFIAMMHEKFNYKRSYLEMLFKQVRKNPKVPSKKSKSTTQKTVSKKLLAKKHRPQGEWEIYSRLHLENNQTNLGVEFLHQHHKTFQKVYEKYGVAPEYIAAIIGIESYYGKNRGQYYVFDSLTHLAFDKKERNNFYKYELQEFLRMCYKEQVEPRAIKGSKSGAIGLAQFMPSNYKSFAIDFDHDGKIRISQAPDAIASVANYFKKNGWQQDEPVTTRVSYVGNRYLGRKTGYKYRYHRRDLLGIKPKSYFPYKKKVMLIKLKKEKYDELWYGANNFYVITRYNHSSYYAMAVHQLAQKIKSHYLAKYSKEPPSKEQSNKKRPSKIYLSKYP